MESLEILWELNTPEITSEMMLPITVQTACVEYLARDRLQLVFFRGVYNLVVSVDIFGPSIGS